MLEQLQLVITVAFAAGGAWFALKEAQRHVNGVGFKVNRMDAAQQEKNKNLSLAIMSLATTEEQKRQLIEWLK